MRHAGRGGRRVPPRLAAALAGLGLGIALPYTNDANLDNPITPGELRMTDASGALASPCEFEPPTYFDVLANAHAEQLRYHLDAVHPARRSPCGRCSSRRPRARRR
jgi:hypothetical protein